MLSSEQNIGIDKVKKAVSCGYLQPFCKKSYVVGLMFGETLIKSTLSGKHFVYLIFLRAKKGGFYYEFA